MIVLRAALGAKRTKCTCAPSPVYLVYLVYLASCTFCPIDLTDRARTELKYYKYQSQGTEAFIFLVPPP